MLMVNSRKGKMKIDEREIVPQIEHCIGTITGNELDQANNNYDVHL